MQGVFGLAHLTQFGIFKTHLEFFDGSMYAIVVINVGFHTWQIVAPLRAVQLQL